MVIIGTFQSEFINDTENQPVIASEARQSRMEIMHMFLRDCFTLFAMTFFYCVIASEAWQSHALVIASEAWQSHALVIASEARQSRALVIASEARQSRRKNKFFYEIATSLRSSQ